MTIVSRLLLIVVGLLAPSGCAPWNAQTRSYAHSSDGKPAPGDSAYLESHRIAGPNYGCSFIEFDGKGGFLNFDQYQHAQQRLKRLQTKSNVLLVIYCHGWNNNAQSADVIRFMSFLRRLADSKAIIDRDLSVQGIYLGWRGSQYLPVVDKSEVQADPKLAADFDLQALVDPRWQLPNVVGLLASPAKYLSYWSIKNRAEFHVSHVPLARAVFGLAFALKNPDTKAANRHHRVFVLGHSFGALVLEQAIGQASVGLLSSEWNRGDQEARWPFDLIVFLNSAAPSLYAKQLNELLWNDYPSTAAPRIISLTSVGDWATGTMHPAGNFLNRFAPDLQRKYHPRGPEVVTAGQYYALTPGHNRYLINHEVALDLDAAPPQQIIDDDDKVFGANLAGVGTADAPDMFYARSTRDNNVYAWQLKDTSVPEGKKAVHTSTYWIGTVPKDIIRNHGDIWSPASMQMLAGVYRLAVRLQKSRPGPRAAVKPD